MKGKRISTSVLAAVMLAGTTATSVFAAMPDRSVVIGEKAFSLSYANDDANISEIREAMKNAKGQIFIKARNVWYNNDNSKLEDMSVIPAVVYKDAEGEKNFEAGDGDEATEGFAIKEISAAGRKKVKVVFTEAADTDKADFVVKKGKNSIRGIDKKEWNEEKTEVVLTMDNDLLNGDFSVEVKGLDIEDNVRTFTTVKENVAELNIVGEKVPVIPTMSGDKITGYTAYITFERLNQYGEETKKGVLHKFGTFVQDDSNSRIKLEINSDIFANPMQEDYQISVNLTNTNDVTNVPVVTSKTLKLVRPATIADVEFGKLYEENTKDKKLEEITEIKEGKDAVVYLALDLKDQYGNKVDRNYLADNKLPLAEGAELTQDQLKELAQFKNFNFTVSDKTVKFVPNPQDDDDQTIYAKIYCEDKAEFNTNIQENIYAVVGQSQAQVQFAVTPAAKVAEVNVEFPEYVVGGETVDVTVTAYNQNGEEIKGKNLEAYLKDTEKFVFPTGTGSFVVERDPVTDEVSVKWTAPVNTGDYSSYVMLNVFTQTNKFSTVKIEVKPEAHIVSLNVNKDAVTKMLAGVDTKISLKDMTAYDQYNRELTYKQMYAINARTGEEIKIGDDLGVKDEEKKNKTWTFTGITKTETKNITWGKDDENSTLKLIVVDEEDIKKLEVDAPEKIYVGSIDNAKEYAKDFVVYGVTASGDRVRTTDSNFNINVGEHMTYANGVITPNTVTEAPDLGDDKKADATVLVIPLIGEGISHKNLNVEVTTKKPVLTELKTKDDKNVFGITGTSFSDVMKFVEAKDQYGVDVKFGGIAPKNIVFAGIEGIEKTNISNNGTANATISGLVVGDEFKVQVYFDGTHSVEYTLKVIAE